MNKFLFVSLFLAIALTTACNSREHTSEREFNLPDEGIEIVEPWARPGRQNGVSAVYLHVLNGSESADTLLSLSSPSAGLVELHETFDRGEGMLGMREAENLSFPGRDVVTMKPGGLHIMLMQLTEALNEGDNVEVTLTFANAGERTINAPVQSPD